MGRRQRLGLEVEPGADYYALLRVPAGATEEEIEHAFHAQAKKFHPDVNPSPDAEKIFQHLVDAHDILTDPALRAEYDGSVRRVSRPGPHSTTAPPPRPSPSGPTARSGHPDEGWRSMWQPGAATDIPRDTPRPLRTGHAHALTIATLLVGLLGFASVVVAVKTYPRVLERVSTYVTVTATRVRIDGVPSLRYVTRERPDGVFPASETYTPGQVVVIHDPFSDASSAKPGSKIRIRYSDLDPTHVVRVDPPRNVMLAVAAITSLLAMLIFRSAIAGHRRRRSLGYI